LTAAISAGALKEQSLARCWSDLERNIIRGKANGQVIWQPRILAWWSDKLYFGEPFPEPYGRMSQPDMYRHLGCSARIYEFNRCFKFVDHPAVRVTKHDIGSNRTMTVISTPKGELTEIKEQRPTCRMAIPVKWLITSRDDLRVATWRAENAHFEFDQQAFDEVFAEWGDLGLPTMYVPRVNVQDLYLNTMGTQAAIYALCDWGDEEFKPYFQALDDLHDQLIDVINSRPAFIKINFGDNLHAGTMPPKWFEKWVLPAYHRRCDRLHRACKFISAHWDGDTGPLLPYARQTHLDAIEAITPLPQGDVTLEQVKEALGDELFLLDGIPAVYFDTTFSVEELEAMTQRIIDLFAPRLILGISDEMAAHGDITRIRVVGDLVDRHNARLTGGGLMP
jgi:hypothetical protein